ncbi:hypothetical protein ACVGVM_17570 [Pseudonocardia bannensis]|uniref:Uncharacterized protein n=1 Tax=Pseudonocardia bannensis TaxID=630973 RepID=A0A848DLE5_9PSEU|nr:hypothetical protein [Pseudonocardia bannensis]NMH93359.1 hypothetical protein [Pseudonocardia bannensis]
MAPRGSAGAPSRPVGAGPGDPPVPVVLGCVIVAAGLMGVLHAAGSTAVDPLSRTISGDVGVPGGYALLGISAVALAVAGCVPAVGPFRAALPRPVLPAVLPAVLLVSCSAALLLVAVLPTNAPGAAVDA